MGSHCEENEKIAYCINSITVENGYMQIDPAAKFFAYIRFLHISVLCFLQGQLLLQSNLLHVLGLLGLLRRITKVKIYLILLFSTIIYIY
jgi:hypothetical protein